MKVYDKEGKEHDLHSVDARECVATLGWTLPLEPKEEEPEPTKKRGKAE